MTPRTDLLSGITIHDAASGTQFSDNPSSWHHATVWEAPNGDVWLRPELGSIEAVRVGRMLRSGRFSRDGATPGATVSRQREARQELAQRGLEMAFNGADAPGLEILGWVRCARCARWLTAGNSIVNGMGPWCSGAQARTERAAKKRAGLDAMQALIDAKKNLGNNANPYLRD